MNEAESAPSPAAAVSPGALLREARERKGLHIAALAVGLKVPVRRLEALEADRHAELPDATFTRSLALSVCRQLQIDPAPVLALLPRAEVTVLRAPDSLSRMAVPPAVAAPMRLRQAWRHPVAWVVTILIVAALAVLFWPVAVPQVAEPNRPEEPVATPAQPAAVGLVSGTAAAAIAPPTAAAGPEASGMPAASAKADLPTAVAGSARVLRLTASGVSWVEVLDAAGGVVYRGTLQAGDVVLADGQRPLKVTLGRADRVEVTVRGQAFDAVALARENVARFEVK